MGLSPEERMDKLVERMDRLLELVDEINRKLEGIEKKLSRIVAPLEDEANDVVTYYLRQRGINIETGPARLGSFEFIIYGTNGQLTIVGAARERVNANFVSRVAERVRNAVSALPSKFPGRVIIVIYSVRADPEAIEEARKQGIWLFESMREKTPFPA